MLWKDEAPADFSAWLARLEKPHIGNCGVPFMNSTIGWPSTSDLMRSMTGLLAIAFSIRHPGQGRGISFGE